MLWFVQVDAVVGLEAVDVVDGGRARVRVGVARKKRKTWMQRKKNEKGPCPYL